MEVTRPARARRGYTLLEIMVACALLGVLTTSLFLLFRTTLSFLMDTSTTASLQASCQKTALQITNEIANSKPSTVVFGTVPAGIVFLSPRDQSDVVSYDANGNPYWQKWVCYYLDTSTQRLIRGVKTISPTVTAPTNPYTPSNFVGSAGNTVVAEYVTSFSPTISGTLLTLAVSFGTTVQSPNDYTIQVQNSAVLHN